MKNIDNRLDKLKIGEDKRTDFLLFRQSHLKLEGLVDKGKNKTDLSARMSQ